MRDGRFAVNPPAAYQIGKRRETANSKRMMSIHPTGATSNHPWE